MMAVHYRDEEAMYVQGAPDRVTVFFSTVFREEADRILGRVFLQVRERSHSNSRAAKISALTKG
jgi:hypothetical protein